MVTLGNSEAVAGFGGLIWARFADQGRRKNVNLLANLLVHRGLLR